MGQTASTAITRAHFEVHVLESDRWLIDYVSASEADALEEAGELMRRPEVAGVRVIKELFNPHTEATAARILFEEVRPSRRRGRAPLHMTWSRPRPAAPSPPPSAAAEPPPPTEVAEESFSWLSLAGLSVVGAVVGGALAVALALLAGP